MIIFYDKNYPPLAILEINSFLEKDYKTFVKLFNSIIEESNQKKIHFNIYIDLYNLDQYSIYNIKDITYYFTTLEASQLQFINKINVYIKKNDSYYISLLKNVDSLAIMTVNIIETEEKNIW